MSPEPFAIPVILIGVLLIADLLLKELLKRTAIPAVVVHLTLGFGLSYADYQWRLLGERGAEVIHFLGSVGIVFLLFRVGLESNARKLLENLRGATFVWLAEVMVAAGPCFAIVHYVLGLDLVPSLFTALAMSVTSVGVSVAVWREEGALDSKRGQLLLDVAELDDVSGIVLMAVLVALAPHLADGSSEGLVMTAGGTLAGVLASLTIFAIGIGLFAHFAEAPLTRLVARFEPEPDRLLTVVSVGLIVAAAAGALGFSLAIGAFFGGLAFSRDPEAVKLDANFDPLYDFFTPFFFVSIGLHVHMDAMTSAIPLGAVLFAVAVGGKLLGAGGGSHVALPSRDAWLLGVSMIPRAEISMVIMQYGTQLGAWAVPDRLFGGMVVVSLLTCIASPIAIRILLRRGAATKASG